MSGDRSLLLAFPNVFEFWFLFAAATLHRRPGYTFPRGATVAWLVALTALKEFQEYALHYARWLDSFTAVEAVEATWNWLTGPIRRGVP